MNTGEWIKSSFSNGSGGNNCVEVMLIADRIYVRDSKAPLGVKPAFTEDEWKAFIAGVKSGEFDL